MNGGAGRGLFAARFVSLAAIACVAFVVWLIAITSIGWTVGLGEQRCDLAGSESVACSLLPAAGWVGLVVTSAAAGACAIEMALMVIFHRSSARSRRIAAGLCATWAVVLVSTFAVVRSV